MESRRGFIAAVGGIGTLAIAGCTSETPNGVNIVGSDLGADNTSFWVTLELENENEDETTVELSSELRIGVGGVYGTHLNETSVTLSAEETITEELTLADRTRLSEAEDHELSSGYREFEIFIDGEQTEEVQAGDAPSRHISFRVLYDGNWQGSLGGDGSSRTIQGTGNRHLPVDDDVFIVSGNAQKQDDSTNELIVQIIVDGNVIAEEATTGEFGGAQVASETTEGSIGDPRVPYQPQEIHIGEIEDVGERREDVDEGGEEPTEELSPEEVVEASGRAVIEGNGERSRELLHSESPLLDEVDFEETGLPEGVTWEIIDTELVEQGEQESTVRREIIEENPDGRYRFVDEVTLRKEDGVWRIWGAEFIEEESEILD